ncbi:MAG: GNAT family N-acetyltransferase [Flavobacteriaceae bacterium]|nr:GNAT family N-acetyltransferase [Flavobacteriaceae bacterium]
MIRAYKKEDFEQLIELIQHNTPPFFDVSEEILFRNYLKSTPNYYVVEKNHSIIAGGGFELDNKHTTSLSWGMVHPNWQGKGVGAELTQFRITEIKKNSDIQKVCIKTSQLVWKFYQKMGFDLLKTEKDFWAKGLDLYEMELALNLKK